MDKTCLKCWKEFSTKDKKRKYCSLKCAYADRVIHKEKECEACWKLFKPQTENNRFCSYKCANSVHRSNYQPDKNCLNCWKAFHPHDKSKKFCSLKCAYEYRVVPREVGECQWCWKEFIKDPPNRKFCSQKCCSQSQIKNKPRQCPICWVTFKPKDAQAKYCSRECMYKSFTTEEHRQRLEELAIQRREDKWYMWVCQTEEHRKKYRAISKPNLIYKDLLELWWYEVQLEFPLFWYSYDLKIWNILIEINPTPFHNSTRHPLAEPKHKYYHYNKYKCAIDNGYKCIMVWDWTTNEELLELIEKNFEYQWEPQLHRYNLKTKEHILDEWFDKEDMISRKFVEVYDCWIVVFT